MAETEILRLSTAMISIGIALLFICLFTYRWTSSPHVRDIGKWGMWLGGSIAVFGAVSSLLMVVGR